MTVVDARPLLEAPGTKTQAAAEATTRRIDELARDLSLAGGGTLFFAAGDYYIQRLLVDGPGTDALPDQHIQGGLRLRPGVNLRGEPGTRLRWFDVEGATASMVGAASPFFDPDDIPACAYYDPLPAAAVPPPAPQPCFTGTPCATWQVIERDVVAGETEFKVENAAAFGLGQLVQVRLGQIPYDAREALWWTYATIVAIDCENDVLTLDQPAGISVVVEDQRANYTGLLWHADPGGDCDNPRAKWIRQVHRREGDDVDQIVHGISISGLALSATERNLGGFRLGTQAGIFLTDVRNVRVANVSSIDTGSGLLSVHYSERVDAKNLHVRRARTEGTEEAYLGRGIGFAAAKSCTADNVVVEGFADTPVFVEAGSRDVRLRNLRIVNSNPQYNARIDEFPDTGLIDEQGGQQGPDGAGYIAASEVTIDGLTIEGLGSRDLRLFRLADAGADLDQVMASDLDLALVPSSESAEDSDIGAADLRRVRGRIRHLQAQDSTGSSIAVRSYAQPRRWTRAMAIEPGGEDVVTTVAALPDGLIRRGKLYLSNALSSPTGPVTSVVLHTATKQVALFVDDEPRWAGLALDLPASWVSLGSAPSSGAEQALDVGVPEPRSLQITANASLGQPGYAVIDLEYFPSEVPDGGHDDRDGAWLQHPGRGGARQARSSTADLTLNMTSWQRLTTLEVTMPASAGDVLYAETNLKVEAQSSTPPPPPPPFLTYFDLCFGATVSDATRWSGADEGYSGWRASGGLAVTVTGSVTKRVPQEVIEDGEVTVSMVYRNSASGSRDMFANNVQRALLDVVNLGPPRDP